MITKLPIIPKEVKKGEGKNQYRTPGANRKHLMK